MRTEKEILAEVVRIQDDERYSYPPALVQVNAPLALIQTEMRAKVSALEWVLAKIKNGGLK